MDDDQRKRLAELRAKHREPEPEPAEGPASVYVWVPEDDVVDIVYLVAPGYDEGKHGHLNPPPGKPD